MRRRKFQPKELIVLTILVVLFVLHSLLLDFTQDDAYISYRYVENFVNGHGLVYNIGERVEGYTNFLWIMLLSIASVAGLPVITVSKVLGVACGAGSVAVTYLYCREFTMNGQWLVPFMAPAFLAANGALCYWVIGGLETGLFVFLFSMTLYLEVRRPSLTSFVLVMATLSRPEGGLLFGLILIYRLLVLRNDPRDALQLAGIYIGLLAPYAVFKFAYFGDLLPNPFYAKTGISLDYLSSGFEYFRQFAYHYGVLGLMLLVPMLFLRKTPNIIRLAWIAVIGYVSYVILVGGDVLKVHRFFLPILPFLFVLLCYSAHRFLRRKSSVKVLRLVPLLLSVGYIAWSLLVPLNYIKSSRYLEMNLIAQMRFMAESIQNTDDTEFSLSTSTIGVVGYTLMGHKVIDMLGLTDSHIARNAEKIEGMQSTWKERNFNSEYLLGLRPDYILFSTGHKASAPAERALLLNSHFRSNYSSIVFSERGFFKAAWKKQGDFAQPNEKLPTAEFANLMYDGSNYYMAGDYQKALDRFSQAAELCKHDFGILEYNLGTCYMKLGQFESARQHLSKALEVDSTQLETWMLWYRLYRSEGDREGMAEAEEKIRDIAPWLLGKI